MQGRSCVLRIPDKRSNSPSIGAAHFAFCFEPHTSRGKKAHAQTSICRSQQLASAQRRKRLLQYSIKSFWLIRLRPLLRPSAGTTRSVLTGSRIRREKHTEGGSSSNQVKLQNSLGRPHLARPANSCNNPYSRLYNTPLFDICHQFHPYWPGGKEQLIALESSIPSPVSSHSYHHLENHYSVSGSRRHFSPEAKLVNARPRPAIRSATATLSLPLPPTYYATVVHKREPPSHLPTPENAAASHIGQ
ncbi:uncharacterized protein BCR38DRAFT_407439 [Pseudomassariella vexata]|uniref:Uncharacterized protein n=1 Tax=Pseudomassariella vexata TaxID=1141098 RepID=A0A1Y2E7C6_9PEZI|nr:uncharacterized protein BCR38DRAFT_407439 [Pseudomassariella vexata]ORY67461.1 hypothetical protein BCR38DRAFT_407439 [Pseudomassariella vexata]